MNEKTWLDYLVAAGTIATPILVLLLSGIGWRLRNRLERQFVLEDKLRDDRIRIYNDILKPFILLLTTDAAWQSDPKNKHKNKDEMALRQLLSLEYRELGFHLSLVGSDEVGPSVQQFNAVFFYPRQQDRFSESAESGHDNGPSRSTSSCYSSQHRERIDIA